MNKMKLTKNNLIKILKGALIVGTGGMLTYLLEGLAQIDFKEFTELVVCLNSILVQTIRKYMSDE